MEHYKNDIYKSKYYKYKKKYLDLKKNMIGGNYTLIKEVRHLISSFNGDEIYPQGGIIPITGYKRPSFWKHIFKMYSNIDNKKFNNYTVILTGNQVGGFGDMVTLFNMYNILKEHINVKVYLLGHTDKNIEELFQLSSIGKIGRVTQWSTDIFSGDKEGYYMLKDGLGIDKKNYIDIISPDCHGLQVDNDSSSLCLYEYGYYHERFDNEYKFSTGLLPSELGLYFTKQYDPIVQSDSKIFFAYFSSDADVGDDSVKLYVYIMFRHILDNFEIYDGKSIKLYLPNGETHKIKDIGEYKFNYTKPNLICQYKDTNITIEVNTNRLSNKEFNELIQISEILVGCTGDQSISQVINCLKIPIYQILSHKKNFFSSLILYAEKKHYPTEYLEKHESLFSWEKYDLDTEKEFEEYYNLLKKWIKSNGYKGLDSWIKNNFNINDVLIGFAKYWLINKNNSNLINQEIKLFNNILSEYDDDEKFNESYNTWIQFILHHINRNFVE